MLECCEPHLVMLESETDAAGVLYHLVPSKTTKIGANQTNDIVILVRQCLKYIIVQYLLFNY